MKTKIGVAFYHRDARKLYRPEWIEKCVRSMLVQQSDDRELYEYQFYELNYAPLLLSDGQRDFYVAPGRHVAHELGNYAEALNYVYQMMADDGMDIFCNTNIDDFYSTDRVQKLIYSLNDGADIASSNYILVDEHDHEVRRTDFANLDVAAELAADRNIVSNPCHMMKRHVFEKLQFDPRLVPIEDLDYWKRCIQAGFRIVIRPEFLHCYRLHAGQEGNKTYDQRQKQKA